jgi:iron complex outermembrane receptor protein
MLTKSIWRKAMLPVFRRLAPCLARGSAPGAARSLGLCLGLCLALCLGSGPGSGLAEAQSTAVLAGRVLDATEGALPGATLVIRPVASGGVRTAVTDGQGAFRLANLQPGAYRVIVRMPGFAEQTQEITLTAGQTSDLAVTLTAAGASETVDVIGTGRDVSSVGTKTDAPLIETPQSVSVISEQQLLDQAPTSIQGAIRYVAGVRAETYGADSRGDWATIRGIDDFGLYLDGLRMLFGWYNNVRPDPFTIERIDILRGPSSVLYGQGSFGGTVNLQSKKPLATSRREVALQFGNYNRKQVAFDLSGPLDAQGVWAYRIVTLLRDSDTQVRYTPDNRQLIAPSITWRPRASTSLTVMANFQHDEGGSSVGFFPWQGTLLPNAAGRIPFDTFISEPGFDEYKTTQRAAGYQFQHKITEAWTVRQNFKYSNSRASYQSLYTAFNPRPVFNDDGRTVERNIWSSHPKATSPTLDTQVQGRFRTGPLQHVILGGLDVQQATITGDQGFDLAPAIDVYAPVYGHYTEPALSPMDKNTQSQRGLYAQDQIKIKERLVALVGGRRDWAKNETVGSTDNVDMAASTGRAGLVYLTPAGVAPYVSYAQSFNPMTGVNFYGDPYKPTRGTQVEIGAKFEPKAKNGLASIAWYDLREQNRLTSDPDNPQNSIQIGEARIRGLELETNAKLRSKIDLVAGYTYTDAKVSKSNDGDAGTRLAVMPAHMASVWLSRPFALGRITGLTAGGGVRYIGSTWDGSDTLEVPGYTLVDLMVSCDRPDWRLAFNVTNLTDKAYVSACLARGDCFYGVRRVAMATISRKF